MNLLTRTIFILSISVAQLVTGQEPTADQAFERLGEQYIDQFAAFSPVRATTLGDHRFDDQLDQISEQARAKRVEWLRGFVERLDGIDANKLSRRNQVDYALLQHELEFPIHGGSYLMATGLADFRGFKSNARIASGVIYVSEESSGRVVAYAIPWNTQFATNASSNQDLEFIVLDQAATRFTQLR